MPWNEKDYPASMKNLDEIVRKKAIDIGNKLVKEGYKDESAIPIAISEAKKWKSKASKEDIKELNKKDITKHKNDPKDTSSRLQDKDVIVRYDEESKEWEVYSKGAKRKDSSFKKKSDAKNRAEEIASNKGSEVKAYTKEESKNITK